MGIDDVEELRHHAVATSQNGWVEVGKKSRGIALDGQNRCELLRWRLVIIPDGTAKEENR